jgi:hypothetical protein
VRWTACLAAASLGLSLLSCHGGNAPKTQESSTAGAPSPAEPKTKPMPPADAKQVQERAETFLKALIAQDFDTLWAMTEEKSKTRVGLADFVRQNDYRERGGVVSAKVESVGGLDKDRALVKTVIVFQWAPTVFADTDPEPTTFNWADEWVRQSDGKWYKVIPQRDEKAWKEAEEICANANKDAKLQLTP